MVRRVALALAVLTLAAALRADERPSFTTANGAVGVTLPASLLQNREVKRQLGSGLTTTFVVIARQLDVAGTTAAKVEIRYDLWDEVYLIRRTEFDGHTDNARIASAPDLEKWWRSTALRIVAATRDRMRLQLDLTVLPFSAAEQQDAREWLSKSGGITGAGGTAGGGLVDALIGTTIHARPLLTFRWTIDLAVR